MMIGIIGLINTEQLKMTNDNKYTFKSDKWFFIWIIVILGEPDIIDGIIKVLFSLSEFLSK